MGRGLGWLVLVIGLVVAAFVVATGVSEAHDQAYCDDLGEDTHYIEDIVANPPGHFMTYASSPHDHLIVKAGTGVSDVTVERRTTSSFNYLGTPVEITDGTYTFEISFTTSQADAVVKICYEDQLGLWWPISVDAEGNPIGNSNSAPETQNLPMPRLDLEIDGGSKNYDVGSYFTDPDNDNLTYTGTPGDTSKVAVTVSGSVLSLTPKATGVTDVTVTASDSSDSADASFTVVVYDAPPLRTTTEDSGIVAPDEDSEVVSKDGNLTVTFPSGTMSTYYQARVDPESDDCGTEAPQNSEYLCLSVDLFDLAGNSVSGSLNAEAEMVLELDSTQYSTVNTELTNNNFNLYKGQTGDWDEIMECSGPTDTSLCFDLVPDGSAGRIEVRNISSFSDFTSSILAPETVVDQPISQTPTTRNRGSGGGSTSPSSNLRPTLDVDDTLQYKENATEPVAEFDADDPDDDELRWELEGPDRKAFEISDEGVLTFRDPPDFENPGDRDGDNEYEITVRVEDDGRPSRSDNEDVSVRVTNENELSAISGDAEVSVTEGQTGVLGQYEVDDPEGDEISWSLTGADAANFEIDQEGNLSLTTELDFEGASAAGTDVYSVTVKADDDGSPQMTSQLSVALSVTNVNEAPESTAIPGVALMVGGGGASVDLSGYFTDPDGDTLSYSVTSSAGSDVVTTALSGSELSITPVEVGSASLEVTGSDAGGLSASAAVTVTVEAAPVTRPRISPIHDEVVRPFYEGFADPASYLGVGEVPKLEPVLWMEQAADLVEEQPRGPIQSVSFRFVPEVTPLPTMPAAAEAPPAPTATPAPTVAAVVVVPRAPTATPVPIKTSETGGTVERQPTQIPAQRPSTPESQRPAVAPVAPTATAVPVPDPQAAESEDDDGTGLPLWLIALLIILGLFVLASLPVWIVNLVIIGGLVGLALVLASAPFWLIILVAVGVIVVLAAGGLVYGIVTRGW